MPQVRPGRAKYPDEVKTRMFEEALVFRGQDGVHQIWRQVVVAHRAPLLSGAVKKVGDQLRFDFRRRQLRPAAQSLNRTHFFPRELHGQAVRSRKIRQFRRPNVHHAAVRCVLPKSRVICFRAVADSLQIGRQLVRTQNLPRRNLRRRGKNLRAVLQDVAGKPRVDHAPVFDVVIPEDADCDHDATEDRAKQDQPILRRPESLLYADTQGLSSRN